MAKPFHRRVKTIPSPLLPPYPCDDCGHIAWARKPLIGGQECVCTVCYPVRMWSPISDADFRAAHTKAPLRHLKPPHAYAMPQREDEVA